MPNLLRRRILPVSVGILATVAAAIWIAASKPFPVEAGHPAIAAADATRPADASCNPASCEAAPCDEAATSAPAHVAAAPAAPASPAPRASAGLVAHLDPETGVIGGMPPGGLESDLVIEREDAARPIDAIASDGSPMQLTNGAFDEYTVVRLDAQGRRVTTCGPNAKALLATPPAPRFEER